MFSFHMEVTMGTVWVLEKSLRWQLKNRSETLADLTIEHEGPLSGAGVE